LLKLQNYQTLRKQKIEKNPFVCLFVCEEETLQKGADSEEIVRTKTTNGRLSEEETFVLSRK
jgi:hypothetical protein